MHRNVDLCESGENQIGECLCAYRDAVEDRRVGVVLCSGCLLTQCSDEAGGLTSSYGDLRCTRREAEVVGIACVHAGEKR